MIINKHFCRFLNKVLKEQSMKIKFKIRRRHNDAIANKRFKRCLNWPIDLS